MMRLRYIVIACFLTLLYNKVNGQYFQFSQYNFTTQRINPALVAASDYASVSVIHRDQSTGGDFNLKSNMLSGAYPLLSRRNGLRWAGVGLTVMDDRSGGIFSTQEVAGSIALNLFMTRFRSLSLGFKVLYQQRGINLDGLYTGSQFVADRGFDQSLSNGENIQFLQSKFLTFSSGIHWQEVDKQGDRTAYWGFSFFDFNKPQDSFSGIDSHLNSTFTFTGGLRVYDADQVRFTPEVLFTRSNANNVINVGGVTGYELKNSARLDFITKYVVGRSGIFGLQLHRENFSIGLSYDFPVVKRNVGNTGAFEIGLELRRLVDPRLKKKTAAKKKSPPAKTAAKTKPPQTPVAKKPAVVSKSSLQNDSTHEVKKTDLKTTLAHKQDSAIAMAEAGNIRHQPLLLEKIVLHFNFEFNSSDLDEKSKQYLNDLTAALKENKRLSIKLTGHTDNVGSAKFNERLSLYRANAIKDYLVGSGVEPERIQTIGKGLSEPLNGNRNEKEMAQNRRVELEILYDN